MDFFYVKVNKVSYSNGIMKGAVTRMLFDLYVNGSGSTGLAFLRASMTVWSIIGQPEGTSSTSESDPSRETVNVTTVLYSIRCGRSTVGLFPGAKHLSGQNRSVGGKNRKTNRPEWRTTYS